MDGNEHSDILSEVENPLESEPESTARAACTLICWKISLSVSVLFYFILLEWGCLLLLSTTVFWTCVVSQSKLLQSESGLGSIPTSDDVNMDHFSEVVSARFAQGEVTLSAPSTIHRLEGKLTGWKVGLYYLLEVRVKGSKTIDNLEHSVGFWLFFVIYLLIQSIFPLYQYRPMTCEIHLDISSSAQCIRTIISVCSECKALWLLDTLFSYKIFKTWWAAYIYSMSQSGCWVSIRNPWSIFRSHKRKSWKCCSHVWVTLQPCMLCSVTLF